MDTTVYNVDTTSRQLVDLAQPVSAFCAGRGNGLLNVYVPHATAGLAVIEVDAGSEPDLLELLDRLLPRDDRYTHRHGATGHGADHVLPALVSPSLVVPVGDGQPLLGTWQHIVLVDLNVDNPRRQVRCSFLDG